MLCRYFESQTRKKYEVIYSDYVQHHPWGKTPQDEWTESRYTYPLNGLRSQEAGDMDGYTQIPIRRLCHVTHNKEADGIRSTVPTQRCYTFKPAQKLGKQYGDDRFPLGETYQYKPKQQRFSRIPRSPDNPVFPGYYSWWGVSVTEWYREGAPGVSLAEEIRRLQRQGVEVAEFVSPEPKSRYGNNSFSIDFRKLLLSYKRSRTDVQERRHIFLRVGGTLRYKWEICYVVIVCLQHDHEFNDWPTLDKQDVLDHNGLVQQGKVVDYRQTPDFKAKHIITSLKDVNGWQTSFSWEQVVFALYYPSEDMLLQCRAEDIQEKLVEHSFCIKKKHGKCPDEYYCLATDMALMK